ncbi:GAS2-like protein 2 [Erinaceus europaeus]|uniref:GAS2-like protein 2 n=1 Tax=Erinaceus europaeus TaxID=9365 RepID=A0A1S2ZBX6_ERIEU|nr:GAS2-like protein 2 [Erinaceus europaeus]
MSWSGGLGRRKTRTPGPPVRSIRPFKSSEQYLEAMKEDLAEWLRDLYGLDIDAANFLQVLETGLVLCQHANAITEAALAFLAEAPAQAQKVHMPQAGVVCNGAAQPGTFQARDNISNFIQWCRKEMGIQEVLMFETEDLVLRKNVKNVVLCLLELGRQAWRFGVAAPTLVQLEEEIEQELRAELALSPPDPPPPPPPPRRPCHFHNLDQMVQNLVSHCTCPVQFSMIKVSDGKYRVGDSNTLIFIRILRNHVMVRVGGGWDTLGHYLDKHDPCRCTSLSHKTGSFLKSPPQPAQHEVMVQDGPSQPQPTMTISRSQSPLPPVDWKIYTSFGRKLRSPACSSPRSCREQGEGTGVLRETAPLLRFQEKSLAPSGRQLPAGDSSSNLQHSFTHSNQSSWYTSSGKNRDPPELPQKRPLTPWVHEETDIWGIHDRILTPQKLPTSKASNKQTQARGPSPPPRSCSPVKSVGLRPPPWGEAEGTSSSHFREPASVHSPSPIKGPTKIPVRLAPAHPPTPGRDFAGTANEGPTAELERGLLPLNVITGNLSGFRYRNCAAEGRPGDQKLGIWVTAESGQPQGQNPQEPEGRSTPLPQGRTKEKAIFHHLEEKLLANMKLLEVGDGRPQSTGSGVIPRSGVYVPSLGGQWPEHGGPYDKVIQELAQGLPSLLKVDLGAWQVSPPGSPKPTVTPSLGSPTRQLEVKQSRPRTKGNLSIKGSTRRRKASPQEGEDFSSPSVSVSPETLAPSPSDPSSDKAKAFPVKGKRTLRKPQRIPSIYKLKLRPRIRPRRDHRPEKRPSRIPKPLTYLHLGAARGPPRPRLMRTAVGSKGKETSLDVVLLGEKEKEGKERKDPATQLENSPQLMEGLGPQKFDPVPLPPEEESWV